MEIKRARGASRAFPPEVAVHLVKLACERPELCGRSLSQWDCPELARALIQSGVTESISPSTARRIFAHHKLKPWRHHMWLSPKQPRDAAFYAQVTALITLYARPLRPDEMVLSLDEKASLQQLAYASIILSSRARPLCDAAALTRCSRMRKP